MPHIREDWKLLNRLPWFVLDALVAQPTHDSQRNSHDSDDSAAPGAVMGISMMVTFRGTFYLS